MKKLIALFAAAVFSVSSVIAGTWDLNANYLMRKNSKVEIENDVTIETEDGKGFQGIITKFMGDPGFVDFGLNLTLGYDDLEKEGETLKNLYFSFGPAVKINLNKYLVLFGNAGFLCENVRFEKLETNALGYGFDVNVGARLYFNDFIGVNAGVDYGVITSGTVSNDNSSTELDVTGGKNIKFYAGIAFRLGD